MSRSSTSFSYPFERGGLFLFVLLFVPTARGAETKPDPVTDDLKRACVAQHEAAQLLRRAGKLSEARATMHGCAQETCPAAVSADCASWLDAVLAAIPSVIVSAKTGNQPEENVSVTVDGKLLAPRLDGRPIELDPGLHTFRFDAPAQVSIEQQVTLAEGEKNRPVNITLTPPEPSVGSDVGPDTYRPTPTLAYVMGGVAVVGLGAFAGFGLWGLNERTSLQSSCSPSCSNAQISSVRSKFVVADAGLGIAALSLAGGAYVYARRPAVERKKLGHAAAYAPSVGFAPAPGGMVLGVQGIF
ncbi:MAG: hypothetical protein M3O36_00455 [Myxococcota bacterium]|nr:hypothetical protein [Myxococcota bacterium]